MLGNHDRPRIAARVGEAQARVAAMLLLTLRGTPTMYYGDEIGLSRVDIPPQAVQDPWGSTSPASAAILRARRCNGTAARSAGFTTAKPWLPLSGDHATRNVAALEAEPGSIFNLYRALIALRRAHRALSIGAFRLLSVDEDVLVYERSGGDERFVVALNFGTQSRSLPAALAGASVLVSTHGDRGGVRDGTPLRADEGLVLKP